MYLGSLESTPEARVARATPQALQIHNTIDNLLVPCKNIVLNARLPCMLFKSAPVRKVFVIRYHPNSNSVQDLRLCFFFLFILLRSMDFSLL